MTGCMSVSLHCSGEPNENLTEISRFLNSFTGGYLGNVGMMLGPKTVETDSQELAGTLTIGALVTGLGLGSLLGPSLVRLL